MSDAYLLTGKRGNGKSLTAMALARNYIGANRPIATNLDIYVEHLTHSSNKTICFRLPDWPVADDLASLPLGNPGLFWDENGQPSQLKDFNEENNGLLLLDEVPTFLSARQWQGQERQLLINWLTQSRKLGWDLCLICLHPKLLDGAIRDSLVDIHGVTKRLDKVMVPILGPLVKFFTGKPLKFPKVHVTHFFYGFGQSAPTFDKWKFFGRDLYDAYNSFQIINGATGNQNLYSLLSPYHLKGRYLSVFEMYKRIILMAIFIGLFFGSVGGYLTGRYLNIDKSKTQNVAIKEEIKEGVFVTGVVDNDGLTNVLLSDGRYKLSSASKSDKDGMRYLVDGGWYRVSK